MTFIFQFALLALVLLSFVLAVGVPVAYASGQDWDRSRQLIWVGSIAWGVLVIVVGLLNSFVVEPPNSFTICWIKKSVKTAAIAAFFVPIEASLNPP